LSLPSPTNPNLHEIISVTTFASETICDIRQLDALTVAFKKNPAPGCFSSRRATIVRRSYVEPLETFETNALGTAHVLEAIRKLELNCLTVVVTSDKCYENREWELPIVKMTRSAATIFIR